LPDVKCACGGCENSAVVAWGKFCSRSCRNIAWVERFCIIPSGQFVGQPVSLRDWQKDIFRDIFDSPTRTYINSVGRKNAKTALAAMILLLFLVGPEAIQNSEMYSTAMARDQAALIHGLAAKMIRLNPEMNEAITIRDTNKELVCSSFGTFYKALSADAVTTLGLSPVLIIHDELGQVKGPSHQLYEACETAVGAQENPLSIIISTQAPTDGDLLSILIDDALTGSDPRVKVRLYTAPEEMDPFDAETIKLANPAFGDFQNATETIAMAEAARRMPSREAAYRNLVLNQRVEASSPFVTKSVWAQSGDAPEMSGILYAGLDLSEVNDLTALVLVSVKGGYYNVKPVFWLPSEGLEERSRQDRVPYDVWANNGYLSTTPGRSVEYEYVANYLANLFETQNVKKIAFDRWNMRHLRPWLVKAGLSEALIEDRFQDFGQGFQSMSPALRTLESLLLNAKLKHGNHPILTMCMANAVVKSDEAGGRKLDKKRSRGRIDGAVALAMACAVANESQGSRPVYKVDLDSILA